jgi:hypothetical protein
MYKMMIRSSVLIIALTMSSAATAEQFSIGCERQGSLHYVTFDTDLKRVIYENASEIPIKGQIISASGDEITFDLIQIGRPKYNLIWRPAEGELTVIGLPDNPARPTIVMSCRKDYLRPVLRFYDKIAQMECN